MPITRREFLASSLAFTVFPYAAQAKQAAPVVLNDIHSQLNRTRVDRILKPASTADLQAAIQLAKKLGKAISIGGGRHAMGGQQFAAGSIHVDTRGMNRILNLDQERATIEVEAGIQWPQLIAGYLEMQKGKAQQWGIAQKQTGADRLCIGGSISANAHGRGLTLKPLVADIESLTLVDAEAKIQRCSRTENAELFRLVNGGYGLFGMIATATLRLLPRRKVERVVEVTTVDDLIPRFSQRINTGYLYGDFQFSIDQKSGDFLKKGVFSCYRPAPADAPEQEKTKELSDESWRTLLFLAHSDKSKAFKVYADYYLSTNGQLYWSDTHQLSVYPDNYHREIDRKMRARVATEIITEINVPRNRLNDFLEEVRNDFRKHNVELIYGTIRLIEKDHESFLPYAKQPYACTIFNLHTVHSPEGIRHS
ncbi:MAG: FAD-dependent oxidoreductase, partial [Acidobacteriales bacterium]|nr:FAD-dependent oxidoreductase [Terriglobales bacterium]